MLNGPLHHRSWMMKYRLHLLLCLAALPLVGVPAGSQSQSATVRTLLRLENDWSGALVRNDMGFFRRILHPDFVYTEDSVVMTKEELIKAITTSGETVTSSTSEGMKVYPHGNTAIVTGILVVNGRRGNETFRRRYRFTDTWKYTNGRWRVIAAQDYLIRP